MKLVDSNVSFYWINMYKHMIRENINSLDYDSALKNCSELEKYLKKYKKYDLADSVFYISSLRFYHNTMNSIYINKKKYKKAFYHLKKASGLYCNKDEQALNMWAMAYFYSNINVEKADRIYIELTTYYSITNQEEKLYDIIHNRGCLLLDENLINNAIEGYRKISADKKIENAMNSLNDIQKIKQEKVPF